MDRMTKEERDIQRKLDARKNPRAFGAVMIH